MEGQDKFVMRELDNVDVGLREDCEEDLVDVGCNADIVYTLPIRRAQTRSRKWLHVVQHVGDVPFAVSLMGQVKIYFSFARLVLIKHT